MQNLDLVGKRILVRVDFNVPLDNHLNVTDNKRIREALPTIEYLLSLDGVSVILMSHLGRPLKKLLPDESIDVQKFSLRNIIPELSKLLGREVLFAENCIGEKTEAIAKSLIAGQVLLLENTRFHKEEEKGDEEFSRQLASLGQAYINDAFGTAHRAHASTCIIARYFAKNVRGFGFLMEKELASATRLTHNPQKPFTAIIGGAKVSDKILLLEKMIDSVDNLIIGGGMAYTFFKAMGGHVGNSLVEEDRLENARQILEKAKGRINLLLPKDSKVADSFTNDAKTELADNMSIPEGMMGLDIGPKAISEFTRVITESKSILWNGPMGVFEMPNFANGTQEIAKAVVEATDHGAFSLIGGGDSAAAINSMGLEDKVSFVSTGGGAMLELLEGKELPGIREILED